MLPVFSQNVTLQGAFETAAQKRRAKAAELDGGFRNKFKLLIDRFPSFCPLNVEIRRENDPSKGKYGPPNTQDL